MGTKLVMSIVQDEDAGQLQRTLVEAGFACTKIGSTGGFLRRGNATFLVGVDEAKVGSVVAIITRTCHKRTHLAYPYSSLEPELLLEEPIEVEVGGAVIFVLDVYETLKV